MTALPLPRSADGFLQSLSGPTLERYRMYWGEPRPEDIERFHLGSYVNKPIIDYCTRNEIDIRDKRVLEFGCRLGSSFLSWLHLDCRSIIGIDIDSRAIDLARRIYHDLGADQIEYRTYAPGERIPISPDEFDIVSVNALLEHLPPDDRPRHIATLSESVAVGGHLIISDSPNRLWYREGHTTGIWMLNYMPFWLKCRLGSMTTRYRGVFSPDDRAQWISEGIVGVKYQEIWDHLSPAHWDNQIDQSDTLAPFAAGSSPSRLKAHLNNWFIALLYRLYCKPRGYPLAAATPSLLCSFRRIR